MKSIRDNPFEDDAAAMLGRALLEDNAALISLLSPDGMILEINSSMAQVLGKTRDLLKGTLLWNHLSAELAGWHQQILQSLVTNPQSQQHVLNYQGRYYDLRVRPCLNHRGEMVGVALAGTDITESRQTQLKLEQSESSYRAMFEVASVGMAQADPMTGQWLRVNPKFCSITGYSQQEMLQMRILQLTHPDDRERDWTLFQRVVRGEAPDYHIEKRYLRKDGTIIWVSVNMTLLRDASGKPLHTVATIEDISERKQMQEHLQKSQKMESIAHLAGGMAHEFNNILAGLMMNLSLIRTVPLDSHLAEVVTEMEGLSQRAAELIKQLLAFSRQSVMSVQPLNWAGQVTRQCKMLAFQLGEGITLEFSYPHELPLIAADKVMLERALLNLCLNARDAMKSVGHLRLSMEEVNVSAEQARAHGDYPAGSYICLSVRDSGCGMDLPTMKRLFEPFFTTKDVGQGTGLGLATVRGIIQQHKGWVDVTSQVGQGSNFKIYLPVLIE